MSKISYVKRNNCVMTTLNKLLSIKIKNEVKEFYKRKLKEKKEIKSATFFKLAWIFQCFQGE